MKYIVRDLTDPIGDDKKLICHCVNDLGVMGAGVAKALFTKWPQVRSEYIDWFNKENITIDSEKFKLGNIQLVKIDGNKVVVNMIGQEDVRLKDGIPPIRYDAMEECIKKVSNIALKYNASIHVPYLMGCDLAGGKWEFIEKILIEHVDNKNIELIIYDLFDKRVK